MESVKPLLISIGSAELSILSPSVGCSYYIVFSIIYYIFVRDVIRTTPHYVERQAGVKVSV